MSDSPVLERILRTLDERKSGGLYRTIPESFDRNGFIDCATNSYLSLQNNQSVVNGTRALVDEHTSGNLASRLVAEVSPLYRELERELAAWEDTPAALVFGSGYAANVGIISAICTRDTEVFTDKLNHASIYDGIALSGCRMNRYRHCDMHDLKERLKASSAKEKVIITDTIFSMDGDRAPLEVIASLAKTHQALLMVDEAHATGLFGKSGSGLAEATGTRDEIDIRMGTFSKALAGLGGYAAVSENLRDYLVNFSRSLVYSTGLPHAVLAHNLAALRFVKKQPHLGEVLQSKAAHFRELLSDNGFVTTPSTTQIIPCYLDSDTQATALSAYLRKRQVIAPAIRPPTVPKGTARIRFSWSLERTEEDAAEIVRHLTSWKSIHD